MLFRLTVKNYKIYQIYCYQQRKVSSCYIVLTVTLEDCGGSVIKRYNGD